MSDRAFQTPPPSAWLLVASCVLIFSAPYLGDAAWLAWVVLACGLYGVLVLARWAGRWLGYLGHAIATGAAEGYQEGVAEARQRRADAATVQADAPPMALLPPPRD